MTEAALKEEYFKNGAFGVLTHLLEQKLVYPDEYHLLLDGITNPSKAIKGAEEVLQKLIDNTRATKDGSYRSEDLFDLIGLLAIAWSQQNNSAVKHFILNGSLSKLPFGNSSRPLTRWKTRFFRLESNGITYFAKESGSKPKGQLVLNPSTHVRDATYPGKKHCFEVITRNGKLCISCNTAQEKELWVCGISRAIHGSRAGSAAYQNATAASINFTNGKVSTYSDERAISMRNLEAVANSLSGPAGGTSDSQETLTGNLAKLAMKSRRNWKVRHFELYRKLFSYSEPSEDGTQRPAKRDIILDDSWQIRAGLPDDVEPPSLGAMSQREACFYLTSEASKYSLVLCASSVEECNTWMQALAKSIALEDTLLANDFLPQSFNSSSFGIAANDKYLEVICTRTGSKGTEARSIGQIPVTNYDTLVSVRNRIYQHLDDKDIPLDFSFLVKSARPVRFSGSHGSKDDSSKGILDRVLHSNYTKLGKKQEEIFSVDKFIEDESRLYLYVEDTASTPVAASFTDAQAPRIPMPPIPPKSVLSKREEAVQAAASSRQSDSNLPTQQQEESKVVESATKKEDIEKAVSRAVADVKAEHESERQRWEREMKKLRSELASTRNALLQAQQGGSSAATMGASNRILSPLETKLMNLQRDGYVEESISCKSLAKEYKRLFEQNDISSVLLDDAGPFAPLLRRYAGEPAHVRGFLEAIQAILQTYTIPSSRLGQAWWKKKLGEVALLKMTKDQVLEWAKTEPWTEDTPERYAYLMGKMRPGAVTDAQMSLIQPVPEFVDEDDDEDDDEDESQMGSRMRGAVSISSAEEEKNDESEKPTRPAFLSQVAGFKKETLGKNSASPKPAFLASIQALKK